VPTLRQDRLAGQRDRPGLLSDPLLGMILSGVAVCDGRHLSPELIAEIEAA
ncbi:uncharacterized protein METZ01_LOCUS320219, partial [marine metagenome]